MLHTPLAAVVSYLARTPGRCTGSCSVCQTRCQCSRRCVYGGGAGSTQAPAWPVAEQPRVCVMVPKLQQQLTAKPYVVADLPVEEVCCHEEIDAPHTEQAGLLQCYIATFTELTASG